MNKRVGTSGYIMAWGSLFRPVAQKAEGPRRSLTLFLFANLKSQNNPNPSHQIPTDQYGQDHQGHYDLYLIGRNTY